MSNDETQFILGSASPRRREILRALGLRFRVEPSRILEPAPSMGERPERYALRVARAKADEVSGKHHSGLVIGADTVVVLGRRILGKPLSAEEARTMLRALSGRWHEVITALCLIDCRSRQRRSSRTVSRVHFRRLSAPEMEWYLTTKEYQDKAGGYAIQGYASLFIDRIEGCYFNVVGFPVSSFERLCRNLRVSLIRELEE